MSEKNRINLILNDSNYAIYRNFKDNHGIGFTKLTNYMLNVADLNELDFVSSLILPKNETDLKLELPERTSDDIPNVINVTARNDIVIASTDKVEKGLIKKGYLPSEITKISRYKNGLKFARDFMEYSSEVANNGTITFNGIVREGDTSLLRNREFSEPLRLVIKELWDTRGIETVLITATERYRLHSVLDYSKMEYQAVKTTFKGRLAQATNRGSGLTEVLRNYLITLALTPSQAVQLTIEVLKANGVWTKNYKELEAYCEHFVENVLIIDYKLQMVAGYNMTELKSELLSAFRDSFQENDENLLCAVNTCGLIRSKTEKVCSSCKNEAIDRLLNQS